MDRRNSAERGNIFGALVVRTTEVDVDVTGLLSGRVETTNSSSTKNASYDEKIGTMSFREPTADLYRNLLLAFRFFNIILFDNVLPECLITVRRTSGTSSCFNANRFVSRTNPEIADEIALDPTRFSSRDDCFILSMLVREMTHLWQYHNGKPASSGYCNRQWAAMMDQIGLVPSSTGLPGGQQTGRAIGHYIKSGGRFEHAYRKLQQHGIRVAYEERGGKEECTIAREKKASSKTRYSCTGCQLNVWGKPKVEVICARCLVLLSSSGS